MVKNLNIRRIGITENIIPFTKLSSQSAFVKSTMKKEKVVEVALSEPLVLRGIADNRNKIKLTYEELVQIVVTAAKGVK